MKRLAAVWLVLLGCGGDAPELSWKGSIDTLPGGVVRVSNQDTGIWGPDEGWTLEQDLRIGKTEDAGPEVFGDIEALAVGAGGDVFLFDEQAQDVRQFNASGGFVRSIGRRGSGPGEFQGAYGIALDPEGNLWVADLQLRRYSVFDSAGALVRTQPMTATGFAPPWQGAFDSEGRLYDLQLQPPTDPSKVHVAGLRLDRSQRVDTLPFLSYDIPLIQGLPPPDRNLVPQVVFHFDGSGRLWYANLQTYRLVQSTLTGDTVRVIERSFAPVPVTAAEKDSLIERYRGWKANLSRSQIPDHRLALEGFQITDDGYLVVQIVTEPAARESVLDVFDPQGRYLGQLRTAGRLETIPAPLIRGDRLYGIVENRLGVEQLVRYRIIRK